jgi:hypothetical protein
MKNIIATIVFCSLFQMATAQGYIPTIKNNTELNYSCKLHGQTRTLTLTAKMTSDTLVWDLNTKGVKSSIVIMPEGLKNGNELSFNQGESSDVIVLKPSETFFTISKTAYQDLVKQNKFNYSSTTYTLDKSGYSNGVVIDGKLIDTFHVVAQIDETEMWIVKNPDFPLICKITKNPLGINFILLKIVDK